VTERTQNPKTLSFICQPNPAVLALAVLESAASERAACAGAAERITARGVPAA
jgi:hypothetical protein